MKSKLGFILKPKTKMNFVGNYKGYPIYRCSRTEYAISKYEGELEENSVYCITDENEILLMNDRTIGQARLSENRVLRFEPSLEGEGLVYEPVKTSSNNFLLGGAKLDIFDLEKFLKEEVKFDLGV